MSIAGSTFPVPATGALGQTNAVSGTGSLGVQASACAAQQGYNPTFTLVDYYDVGNGSVFGEFCARDAPRFHSLELQGSSVCALTRRVRRPAQQGHLQARHHRQRHDFLLLLVRLFALVGWQLGLGHGQRHERRVVVAAVVAGSCGVGRSAGGCSGGRCAVRTVEAIFEGHSPCRLRMDLLCITRVLVQRERRRSARLARSRPLARRPAKSLARSQHHRLTLSLRSRCVYPLTVLCSATTLQLPLVQPASLTHPQPRSPTLISEPADSTLSSFTSRWTASHACAACRLPHLSRSSLTRSGGLRTRRSRGSRVSRSRKWEGEVGGGNGWRGSSRDGLLRPGDFRAYGGHRREEGAMWARR